MNNGFREECESVLFKSGTVCMKVVECVLIT